VATGAHAFAVIWDELPRYRRLARLLRSLRLLPVLERLYGRFGPLAVPAALRGGRLRHAG